MALEESPLEQALRQFDATEANIAKLERLWGQIEGRIPQGVAFESDSAYDHLCRAFREIWDALPAIDGWKPKIEVPDLDTIAQGRFDAMEIGEIEAVVSTERAVERPGRDLEEYRHRFTKSRRRLVRGAVSDLVDSIDGHVAKLRPMLKGVKNWGREVRKRDKQTWAALEDSVAQLDALLGSSTERSAAWGTMQRHLRFGQMCDMKDIAERDWPAVKDGLTEVLYVENEPLPVAVPDLGELAATSPTGRVATNLKWESLDDERFERLIFCLIRNAPGYENPQWLTKTRAPDAGRDLSVERVVRDRLSGTTRQRVIIQCRHRQGHSVAPTDVATLKEQMRLWEPPRVDVLVIATSGRFTKDAIQGIEKHNQGDHALRIEMWPESHLEGLLASSPALVAEFRLR